VDKIPEPLGRGSTGTVYKAAYQPAGGYFQVSVYPSCPRDV